MEINWEETTVLATASTTVSIPSAIDIDRVLVGGDATAGSVIPYTSYTIQTAAPTSDTECQFTGGPSSPSQTLTFNAALTAGAIVHVRYAPPGSLPAAS